MLSEHMSVRAKFSTAVGAAAAVVMLCFAPGSAVAQNSSMQELLNRVDRLQRELTTLQRQVYQGQTPQIPAGQPVPAAAGDSSDPRSAARNSIRITQLENEIRRLTGRMEEVDFALRGIQGRLDKLVADLDQRLAALEGGSVTAAPPALPTPNTQLQLRPPPQSAAPQLVPPQPQATSAPPQTGARPGVLGTIPKDLAVTTPRGPDRVPPAPPVAGTPAPAATAAQTTAALPAGTPQAQYDYALSLMLKKQDFDSAERALKEFVDRYPSDPLTGNAQYWLGETYYVRKSYQDAAFAFAEGFQKFPKSNKAPDSLLKLGMSLAQLDKRREACTAFSPPADQVPRRQCPPESAGRAGAASGQVPVTGGVPPENSVSPRPVSPDEFAALMAAAAPYPDCPNIAVAVSGGADSMALLYLLASWADGTDVRLSALTVDHGLRAESAAEAARVADLCATRGIRHRILEWTGEKPGRGIQAAARDARYRLLEGWCRRENASELFVAHTQNDQAETFLFRMGRGSGPDGLAGMPLVSHRGPLRIVRPLLGISRNRLEETLRRAGQGWIDDPGNRDHRYARVRIRAKVERLAERGITVAAIAGAARLFGQMRAQRDREVSDLARDIVSLHEEGYADIDGAALADAEPGIASALLAGLIRQAGGGAYAPKRARLDRLMSTLRDGPATVTRTLGNCIVSRTPARIRVCREFSAVRHRLTSATGDTALWDGRFELSFGTAAAEGTIVSALGEAGWQAIAGAVDDRFRDIPGPVRYGLPAVRNDREILQVWHLGYRSPQLVENIVQNAQFRWRSPVAGPPFWVA